MAAKMAAKQTHETRVVVVNTKTKQKKQEQ